MQNYVSKHSCKVSFKSEENITCFKRFHIHLNMLYFESDYKYIEVQVAENKETLSSCKCVRVDDCLCVYVLTYDYACVLV